MASFLDDIEFKAWLKKQGIQPESAGDQCQKLYEGYIADLMLAGDQQRFEKSLLLWTKLRKTTPSRPAFRLVPIDKPAYAGLG